MTARVFRVAALLAVLPLAGCGTVANLTPANPEVGRVPFGGVKHDLACLRHSTDGACDRAPCAGNEQYPHTALALLCAADVPLSLVGDLVTLPYVKVYAVVNAPVTVPPITFADPGTIPPRPPAPPAPKLMPPPVPPVQPAELPKVEGALPLTNPQPLPKVPQVP